MKPGIVSNMAQSETVADAGDSARPAAAQSSEQGGPSQIPRGKQPERSTRHDQDTTTSSVQSSASESTGQGGPAQPGKGKQPEQPNTQPQNATSAAAQATAGDGKLSAKELKAQKQAEKQARRQAEKVAREGSTPAAAPAVNGHGGPSRQEAGQARQRPGPQQPQAGTAESRTQHRRTASQSQAPRPLALRRRPSQTLKKEPRKGDKEVGLFGHLYNQPRRYTLDGVSKEVHPAVLALGFQMSSYVICGSNARCVAMLLAFKQVRR